MKGICDLGGGICTGYHRKKSMRYEAGLRWHCRGKSDSSSARFATHTEIEQLKSAELLIESNAKHTRDRISCAVFYGSRSILLAAVAIKQAATDSRITMGTGSTSVLQ